jgi:hypothetical protein
MTRVSLRVTDNLVDGIIAKQIVELAKTGERNPDLLCEVALKKIQEHLYAGILSAYGRCLNAPPSNRFLALCNQLVGKREQSPHPSRPAVSP